VTVLLEQAAWPAIPGAPLVLVPLGSTEQHGPHLPFSTDCTIAAAVAAGTASALSSGDEASTVVVPVIPYGASGEHQSFPGTVSIGHEALQVMLVELVRSLATWAGRIVFVNGHGGNVESLARVIPRLIVEGHDVAWAPCAIQGGDAHAGRTETSIMLHLAPELVDRGRIRAGNPAPLGQLLPLMRAGGTRVVSPSGVLGDPTGAGAAEGADLLAEMVDGVVRRLRGASVDQHGRLRDTSVVADSVPGAAS
jgi:mycofactocin system creatininase family protein